jgi:hypothetical protein
MRRICGLAAFAIALVMFTSATASETADVRAVAAARKVFERAMAVGNDDVIPKQLLRSASVGKALPVYDARTLEVAYRIVPIEERGRTLGIIAVDSNGDSLLWCRFKIAHDRFPVVAATEASRIIRDRRATLGLVAESGEPILVQGCDKHIYWRFGPGNETWLVDAVKEDASVLSSVDGSNRKVITPEPAAKYIGEPLERRDSDLAPDTDRASFANPPVYVIPGIPYHFQIVDWYCGPASLQMIMDWLGEEIGQYDIGDVANEDPINGCYETDMRRAAHFSGMSAAIQHPALEGYVERKLGYACIDRSLWVNMAQRLKNTICAGYPVYTLTWYDGSHTSGHFRVVKGYDDGLGVFVIHDPWYYGTLAGPDLLIDQALFVDNLWVYDNHWCMVLSPWILTPSFPASVTEGDTFKVSLKVLYPGPTVFSAGFPCSDCRATISLSSGLALAGGSPTILLPNMDSGDTANASWDVVAVGPPGDRGMAFQAQGIVTGSSTSYASYSDSIGGHAYEAVTVGAGQLAGWDAEERLTVDAATSETCWPGARAMAVGEDGAVHVVWADTRDANSEIYYRRRVSGAWGAETRLTNDPGYSHSPCIAVDPDGGLHVAWVDDRNGNYEIYYKKWDAVSGWSADERVTNYYEVDSHPAIAASTSRVYVAWESRVDGYYRTSTVYMAVRSDAGWSAPAEVDASVDRDRYRPSVAFGPGGLLHIVYERQTSDIADEKEEIAHRSWNGTSWSAPATLSTSVSFSRNPVVAVGSDSTVHVVWQDGENVGGDIFYALYDGSSWQPREEIVTGATEAGTPSVAVDGGRSVYVVWVDHRHGESEIYFVSKDTVGWHDAVRLSKATGASMLPAVAAGAAGGACVLWTDLRNGNADLYFRGRSDASGVADKPSAYTGGEPQYLSLPWPAPFMDETRVVLGLERPTPVEIDVFDVAGRLIRTLCARVVDAGVHDVVWDGRDGGGEKAAPGVYFLRCSVPNHQEVRHVVLVR